MAEDDSRRASYVFIIPKDETATHVTTQIKYRDLMMQIRFEDTDQGLTDLLDLLEFIPRIAKECRQERSIHREVKGMDSEIEELLEGDE